ncbi:hypothetical protein F3J39_06180 [Pantoea sp. Acro-807]|nr:hypothetical protein [Pantoea sp. Acro-807]RAU29259.1 hypothetical protein DBY66_016990 [Pantoea sp. RIT 413]
MIFDFLSLLLRKESEKDSSLTKDEVNSIRDTPAISFDREVALTMSESRGYRVINSENYWCKWLDFRSEN